MSHPMTLLDRSSAMDSRKIVYVTQCGYPLRFFGGLTALFRMHGLHLHVVSSPDDQLWHFRDREGCVAHAVPTSRTITPLQDAASVFRLWRTLRRIRPAVVQSHMSKAGVVGMAAAWLARVPIRIYTNHGVAFSSASGWKRAVLRAAEQLSCRLASHVQCVSQSVRELMIAEGCCREEKIRVLANGSCGVDATGRFNPQQVPADTPRRVRLSCRIPPDALVLGFVGRVAELKGVDDLARAWQALRTEHPDLHLLIVGGADARSPIRPQTDALLRSDPRVHLVNEVADTVPYFSAMDLQVLPSVHEGLPVSLLEGAAMELPIVASHIPGNVDAVQHGVTGTLVPVHDVPALTAAIGKYLKDPILRRKHGLAGRERILRDFQREIVWEAMLMEYDRLLREIGLPVLARKGPANEERDAA